MKKIFVLIITLIVGLTSTFVFGCTDPEQNKVNIKYYAEAKDVRSLILGGTETIGLVPEPMATGLQNTALDQGKTLYRLDLQELYDENTKAYPQAVLMVKKSVIGAHQDLASTLQTKITESVLWAKANAESAVNAIGKHGATTLQAKALSESVIDACKIYWQSAESAKQSVKEYINAIIDIDSAKAKAISDDFFYSGQTASNQKGSYTFVMPDGAPALALSKLLNDNDNLKTRKNIDYSVVTSMEIRNHIVSGSADFILMPVNMATQYYKEYDENDPYLMVSVVTHGNLYIISTEKITVQDLKGKRVAVPMKGAVPDWTFQMVLRKHNLGYLTLE